MLAMRKRNQAMLVKLPVLVAVGSEPLPVIVMPLIGEAERRFDCRATSRLPDQPVSPAHAPLTRQEGDNFLAASKEFERLRQRLSAYRPGPLARDRASFQRPRPCAPFARRSAHRTAERAGGSSRFPAASSIRAFQHGDRARFCDQQEMSCRRDRDAPCRSSSCGCARRRRHEKRGSSWSPRRGGRQGEVIFARAALVGVPSTVKRIARIAAQPLRLFVERRRAVESGGGVGSKTRDHRH